MSAFDKIIDLRMIRWDDRPFDFIMFQQILRQIEIFTSSVQNNLSRTSMTADEILVDKFCHTFSGLDCTHFDHSAQIVSCKYNEFKSSFLHSPSQIKNIDSYFLPYHHASCRVYRLLLPNSRSTPAFFEWFDVVNVIIHFPPLISPVQLIIGPLLPMMSNFIVKVPENLRPLFRFPDYPPRRASLLPRSFEMTIANEKGTRPFAKLLKILIGLVFRLLQSFKISFKNEIVVIVFSIMKINPCHRGIGISVGLLIEGLFWI